MENGAPFVMVANGMPWDCHVFNHEVYQMIVPDMDKIIYHLVGDLEERGLLEDTLVVIMGEFGRTPWINAARGRDHYPNAWSLALAGCGIRGGVVAGATDEDGVDVKESPYDERHLFATIFTASGLWGRFADALRHPPAMRRTLLGAVFGPFLGVSFSLVAVQHTMAGVAATIMAITPVVILPLSVWRRRERVTARAVFGALLAVAGTAVLVS